MEYCGWGRGSGGPRATRTWWVEDKRGRMLAFGLSRAEAKQWVRGTSHRARQW